MNSKARQALAPDDVKPHASMDYGLLRRLWVYILPYRGVAFLTLLLSLSGGGFRVLQPWLAKHIIDGPIANKDMPGVLQMIALYLGVILLAVVTEVLFSYLSAWVGQRSMHDLRRQLFSHILGQDTVFFDRNPVGRLITRMTSDVGTLNELFASGVVATMGELLVLFGVLGLMVFFNLKLTLILLIFVPIAAPVVIFFRRHSRKWYLETRLCLATMNTYLQENITGMRTVQSFNRESANHAQFRAFNDEYRKANINTIFAFALFFPVMAVISSLGVATVIWVGGRDLINGRLLGQSPITFGELFLFVQCVQMLFHPIRALSEKFNLLQAAMASSERIFHLLDRQAAITGPEQPKTVPALADAIRFEDVRFAYVPEDPVLKGVSFEIPRGKTVAVVGATGAGKTTLINLMTRFYDTTGGRITLDGNDIRDFDPQQLRRRFAVVLQEVFLFSGTIAENLRLANPDLTEDQMWSILREVGADDFVASLPGGLEGMVTERGGTFSTGQKQLLAFARALAADPEILILDEATANIDTATEQKIQDAIARLLVDRTALVIAHRLSTIQRADNILVMHHGHLHESGTHDQLLRKGGIYRRLYELQYHHMNAAAAD